MLGPCLRYAPSRTTLLHFQINCERNLRFAVIYYINHLLLRWERASGQLRRTGQNHIKSDFVRARREIVDKKMPASIYRCATATARGSFAANPDKNTCVSWKITAFEFHCAAN